MEERRQLRAIFYRVHPQLRTVILHHPDCNLHIPRTSGTQGANPWEAPPRITAILQQLHAQIDDWAVCYSSDFPLAGKREILKAHSLRYFELLCKLDSELMQGQSVAFTPHVQQGFGVPSEKIKDEGICDTSISKGSLQAALRAAGGAIAGVDKGENRGEE